MKTILSSSLSEHQKDLRGLCQLYVTTEQGQARDVQKEVSPDTQPLLSDKST